MVNTTLWHNNEKYLASASSTIQHCSINQNSQLMNDAIPSFPLKLENSIIIQMEKGQQKRFVFIYQSPFSAVVSLHFVYYIRKNYIINLNVMTINFEINFQTENVG